MGEGSKNSGSDVSSSNTAGGTAPANATEAVDAQAFHEFELAGWEHSVQEYDSGFTALTRQTIPTMFEAIGPVEGRDILDLACGPGELARALSDQGARVTGSDFSPAMLEYAAAYADSLAITWQLDNAETLETFPSAAFDVVAMNYGILHLGRPFRAMRAVWRVLRPGGAFVFSCWQNPERAQGFAAILDAVATAGVVPQGMPHGPDFFHFASDGNVRSALSSAGFVKIEILEVNQEWELPSAEALFDAFVKGTARTGGMLRSLPDEELRVVRELAVENANVRFAGADGTLKVPMPAKVARGLRAG